MAGKKGNKAKPTGSSASKATDSSASNQSSSTPFGGKLKGAQSINVRHILCQKHAKKEVALRALRGELTQEDKRQYPEIEKEMPRPGPYPFNVVAGVLSEDKRRQGGSLGWKPRGSLLAPFEKVAYELESSTVANPKFGEATTGEGYHIIMVEGRK